MTHQTFLPKAPQILKTGFVLGLLWTGGKADGQTAHETSQNNHVIPKTNTLRAHPAPNHQADHHKGSLSAGVVTETSIGGIYDGVFTQDLYFGASYHPMKGKLAHILGIHAILTEGARPEEIIHPSSGKTLIISPNGHSTQLTANIGLRFNAHYQTKFCQINPYASLGVEARNKLEVETIQSPSSVTNDEIEEEQKPVLPCIGAGVKFKAEILRDLFLFLDAGAKFTQQNKTDPLNEGFGAGYLKFGFHLPF